MTSSIGETYELFVEREGEITLIWLDLVWRFMTLNRRIHILAGPGENFQSSTRHPDLLPPHSIITSALGLGAPATYLIDTYLPEAAWPFVQHDPVAVAFSLLL